MKPNQTHTPRKRLNSKRNDTFPVRVKGLSVDVERHKNFDAAMNKWMRLVQEDGKLDELKERRFYEKPSQRRRRRMNKAKLKERYRRENEENSHI